MSLATDWVFWKFRSFLVEMRYDAAIWNRRKVTENLEASCQERFKAIHALEERIVKEEVSVEENLKILNGAVSSYAKDGREIHRVVGEQALKSINKSRALVAELKAAQEQHRKDLTGLRVDHQKEGNLLQDLVLDKPRLLAELTSSWMESVAYKRASRPTTHRKADSVARKYHLQATSQRDSHRFLTEDIFSDYRDTPSEDVSVSEIFEDMVKKRMPEIIKGEPKLPYI